jgi:hypothetical protein
MVTFDRLLLVLNLLGLSCARPPLSHPAYSQSSDTSMGNRVAFLGSPEYSQAMASCRKIHRVVDVVACGKRQWLSLWALC